MIAHFEQAHWTGLFACTCDEPPNGCDEPAFPAQAQAAQAAGLPNLVTTTYTNLQQKGCTDLVDILTPVAETMNDQSPAAATPFSRWGPQKRLWWYQSCDSHGCGGCDASNASFDPYHGPPSYVIDSDAAHPAERLYRVRQEIADALDDQRRRTGMSVKVR